MRATAVRAHAAHALTIVIAECRVSVAVASELIFKAIAALVRFPRLVIAGWAYVVQLVVAV